MYSFKKSIAAFTGLLVLVAAFAALMPLVGQGQGKSDTAPPHRGPRKFYLTQNETYNGSQALTACAAGYHMASLWEVFDPSNLKYDTQLGFTQEDSGSGPPSNSYGWIRTGAPADNGNTPPGAVNCTAWTSASDAISGSFVALDNFWNTTPVVVSPWFAGTSTCDTSNRVWCVQD